MKEGWSNRFLGQMLMEVLMRCRSFKLTSLFTYSSNQLKFVFDVAYDETKRQSHGTHGQITKFMYQSQQPPHLKFSVISISRARTESFLSWT